MQNIQADSQVDEIDAVDNTEMSETKKSVTETPPEPQKQEVMATPAKASGPSPKAIALNPEGILTPVDSNEEWRMATIMLQSTALPQQFKNVAQVLMAMQFLRGHGLDPIVAIRQTAIINGTLSIWGELPLGICIRSGELEEHKEFWFDKDYNEISFKNKNLDAEVWGSLTRIKRKGHDVVERSFTVKDAKTAQLFDKSIWKLYPRRMLQMRARSHALKDEFPDILSGIAIAEYDHNSLGPGGSDGLLPEPSHAMLTSIADEINGEIFEKEANPGSQAIGQNP